MTDNMDEMSGSYAHRGQMVRTLDHLSENALMSVYCECGRIVILGRAEMKLKLSLGKELECMACRNARISREIDALDDHFNGIDEVESWLV